MEMTVFWLVAVALAQSAIAMSVYFIRLRQPRPDGAVVDDFLGHENLRLRRSAGFGGFPDFESHSNSWFSWGDDSPSHSNSDFSPPHFEGFGGHGKGRGKKGKSGFGGKGKSGFGGKGNGRAEASLGPIFITKVDVPDVLRDKFNAPQERTPEERRAKYGLNREFFTPPHAYKIGEVIPFFDTFDHKTAMLSFISFRAENNIPLPKLKSIRPFDPFFIKD